MPIADYKTTPALNTTINGINIDENCPAGNVNNAIRQLMADIAVAGVTGNTVFVSARSAGVPLDSNLSTGGGTNATAALQALIDAPRTAGKSLCIVIDGPALVSGLTIGSNTTIWCLEGGGFYLANNSNQAIFRNKNMVEGANRANLSAIVDENISFIGGTYNGNQGNQIHRTADYWITGFRLHGVRNLRIYDVDLKNSRTFGYHISCAENVHFRGGSVAVPLPGSTPEKLNQDGIHFNGPVDKFSIVNMRIAGWDDGIALNADDGEVDLNTMTGVPAGADHWWKHVGAGPITNGIVRDVHLDGSLSGVRLLSKISRMHNITLDNIFGTTVYHWLEISQYPNGSAYNAAQTGDVGHVSIINCNVQQTWTGYGSTYSAPSTEMASMLFRTKIERLRVDVARDRVGSDGLYGFMIFENHANIEFLDITVRAKDSGSMTGTGGMIFFVGADIEHCKINAIYTRASGIPNSSGSLLSIQGGSVVGSVEITGHVQRVSNVVALEGGSTLERINFTGFTNEDGGTGTDQGGLIYIGSGITSPKLSWTNVNSAKKVTGPGAATQNVVNAEPERVIFGWNGSAITIVKKTDGISGVSRTGTGTYRISFSETIPAHTITALATNETYQKTIGYMNDTATYVDLQVSQPSGAAVDAAGVQVVIHR